MPIVPLLWTLQSEPHGWSCLLGLVACYTTLSPAFCFQWIYSLPKLGYIGTCQWSACVSPTWSTMPGFKLFSTWKFLCTRQALNSKISLPLSLGIKGVYRLAWTKAFQSHYASWFGTATTTKKPVSSSLAGRSGSQVRPPFLDCSSFQIESSWIAITPCLSLKNKKRGLGIVQW